MHDAGGPNAVELSVIIPCLNEAETIGACVAEARTALDANGLSGEVIVADNGSTDNSAVIAAAAGARVVHVPAPGYGSALVGGILQSRGDWFLFADADGSYDFGEVGAFVAKLRGGADFVMGCRFPSGGGRIETGAMPLLHRLGTPVMSFVGRRFFQTKIADFNCGMRAMRRGAFDELDLRCPGMEFASEMIIKASLKELKVAEVPISLRHDKRTNGRRHLRTFRDGWRHLRLMLLLCPRWLFLFPAVLCIGVGLGAGLPLIAGPVAVGSVKFDTNTLLVCAMLIILGHQLLSFGLAAELIATSRGLLREGWRTKLLDRIRLEVVLAVGLVSILGGGGLIVGTFLQWERTGFGILSYPDSLRMIIPGTTLVILGIQTIFSGFLVSLLQMRHLGGWSSLPAVRSPEWK